MFVNKDWTVAVLRGQTVAVAIALFLKGLVILQSTQSHLDGKMDLRNPTNPAAL